MAQRFYCTQCQKIKRVSVLPPDVENPYDISPLNRIGVCRWHTTANGSSHRAFLGHKPGHRPSVSSQVAPTPKKAGRKARPHRSGFTQRRSEDVA